MNDSNAVLARRTLLKSGLVIAGAVATPQVLAHGFKDGDVRPLKTKPVDNVVAPVTSSKVVRPELLRRALASLDAHASRIPNRDRIAIADFAAPSRQPRFHIVDVAGGKSTSYLVAHGSGSDPSHTGWLSRFSNVPDSNASSEGAFLADDYYTGKHGHSQRLIGLDNTNDNALARAIVVHSAWYSNPDMIRTHGMLGRSQGCFAVGEQDLAEVMGRLGQGRMIYSAKV